MEAEGIVGIRQQAMICEDATFSIVKIFTVQSLIGISVRY
jgi:hypothetical protein